MPLFIYYIETGFRSESYTKNLAFLCTKHLYPVRWSILIGVFFFLTVHELLSSSGCMITGYGSGGGGGIMDQAAQGS